MQMKSLIKYVLIVFLVLLLFSGMIAAFGYTFSQNKTEVSLTQLVSQINSSQVKGIIIRGDIIEITLNNDSKEWTNKEPGVSIAETLVNLGVDKTKLSQISVDVKNESGFTYYLVNFLPTILIFLFIIFIFWFMFRQAQRGSMQAFSFGKTKARLAGTGDGKKKVMFDDVAGLTEAKEEISEVVEFLSDPKKFHKLGARIPRGILLIGAPGTGKCLTGNIFISTNKGLIEISEIPKYFFVDSKTDRVSGAKVSTIDLEKADKKMPAPSHWYNLGKQKTIKIETRIGLSIEGTAEHPVVIVDKNSGDFVFKKLSEIKKGDVVVINYNQQAFGNYKKIPDYDTAYILGLLCGDGGLSIKNRIYFTNSDKELINKINGYFKKNFNKTLLKTNGKYDYLLADSVIKEKMMGYGVEETYAKNKKIPDSIMLAPKEYITHFLRGLFDTDGYCGKEEVELSSSSKKLAEQVSVSLWNLGVINRLHSRVKRYNGQLQHYITVSGGGLGPFLKQIGFSVPHKQRQLEFIVSKKRNSNVNLVFHQQTKFASIWRHFRKSTGELSRSFYAGNIYKQLHRYLKYKENPSLETSAKILKLLSSRIPSIKKMAEYKFISKFNNGGLFLTPVTEKKNSSNVVYDFTVPKLHSFSGNFFINHNTLLAKAVANEANVPFYFVSGSEFVEMFVGVGANRVRDTFEIAKKTAPSIIFIDEIDAVGRHRGAGLGGGHDEREQTLNQILVEMDGFDTNDACIVIAATNRPDILDPALLRPGRFDRRVTLDEPSMKDREAILKIHALDKPLAKDVNLKVVAERTPGFSGADLANLLNEAAILAVRENQKEIIQVNLLQAIEKVMLGPERRSHILTKKEKEIAAYHEAGHALVAVSLPYTDPIHKISVVSRGQVGGYTLKLPSEDRHLRSKSEFESELAMLLGGYAAERLVFNELTTGAANDLKVASDLARKMVSQFGMSDKLGPIAFGEKEELVFLGKEIVTEKNYSNETAFQIDSEVKALIFRALKKAREVLTKKMTTLTKIATELNTKETLEQKEFYALLKA